MSLAIFPMVLVCDAHIWRPMPDSGSLALTVNRVEVPSTLYSLRKEWNKVKAEVAPWWSENSKFAYESGLKALADALKNHSDSKRGLRAGAG